MMSTTFHNLCPKSETYGQENTVVGICSASNTTFRPEICLAGSSFYLRREYWLPLRYGLRKGRHESKSFTSVRVTWGNTKTQSLYNANCSLAVADTLRRANTLVAESNRAWCTTML